VDSGARAEIATGGFDVPRVAADTPDVPMAAHRAIAGLIAELRPDLPGPLVDSLVVEVLDIAAAEILNESWARAREALWPEAVAAARTARVGASYAERRALELASARRTPHDFLGRRHLHSVRGGAA
jgi:hypothetical protein